MSNGQREESGYQEGEQARLWEGGQCHIVKILENQTTNETISYTMEVVRLFRARYCEKPYLAGTRITRTKACNLPLEEMSFLLEAT